MNSSLDLQPDPAVNGDANFRCLAQLAQQRDLVERKRFLDRPGLGHGVHPQRVQHSRLGPTEPGR